MPQFRCPKKGCEFVAESIGQFSKHRVESGHKKRKTWTRRTASDTPPPADKPELDAELTAIAGCVAAIDEQLESIDSDGLARVVSYLTQRYAPANAPVVDDVAGDE